LFGKADSPDRQDTSVGIEPLRATFLKKPYISQTLGAMQGCWGPDAVMEKAVAAFTPNVAWMDFNHPPNGFSMSGGGTSASTPQIAAACALWLERYGNRLLGLEQGRSLPCRIVRKRR
jgi:hypothetical protein